MIVAPVASDRGSTLIELLVSTALTMMIVGGLGMMLTSTQFVYQDTAARGNVQQAARMALDRIQRDVMLTGVGLTPMLPVFPLVVPRVDGGIDLRANPQSATVLLDADMTGLENVFVPQGAMFQPGEWVAVYDARGAIELGEVEQLWPDRFQLVAPLSKNYEVADTAAVAKLSQTSYYLETQGGIQVLMRQVDARTPQPIASNVLDFRFRYFDDSLPPVEFIPDTPERQLRIRTIHIELSAETADDRIQSGDRASFTLRARVVPRALSIVRG